MGFIRIKNWETYQHYKDRNPPWIKLHRELITSETWVSLNDAGRVLAISIMLLAAASGNRIKDDLNYIKRVAYLHDVPNLSPLFKIGFIERIDEIEKVDSTSEQLHTNARPEGETEESREEEKEESLKKDSSSRGAEIFFDREAARFTGITDQKIELWGSAYPALNLQQEISKATAWLMENPKNKKKNYGKFLTGWMSRAQERAPRVQGQYSRRKMLSPAGG